MREEDALSAKTHAAGPNFSDTLSKTLSQHLPCYMLPQIDLNNLDISNELLEELQLCYEKIL